MMWAVSESTLLETTCKIIFSTICKKALHSFIFNSSHVGNSAPPANISSVVPEVHKSLCWWLKELIKYFRSNYTEYSS